MHVPLFIPDSLVDAAEYVYWALSNPGEVLIEAIASLFVMLLIPVRILVDALHAFAMVFLTHAPYPGETSDDDAVYVFGSPDEGDIFYGMMEMTGTHMEAIAMILVIFGIVVLLFLSVFDVVIDDIGIDTQKAKKRLLIAPLFIMLWVPMANLTLYMAFGMTEFFGGIEFPETDQLSGRIEDDGTDVIGEDSDGLTVGSYVEMVVPETGGDIIGALLGVVWAYMALVPALLLYILVILGAMFRVFMLYFLYVLGPVAIAMWAINWRELADMGGKIIRYYILLAFFPVAVALINTVAPVFFLIMEELASDMATDALTDDTVDADDDNNIMSEPVNMISPTEILAGAFIMVTPIVVGILPWAMIIGLNKAMAIGGSAGGLALAATGVGAIGAMGGISGMANMAGSAAGGMGKFAAAGKGAMLGTMAGQEDKSRTEHLRDMKNMTAATGMAGVAKAGGGIKRAGRAATWSNVKRQGATAKYAAKDWAENTEFSELEERALESGVFKKSFGSWGDGVHKALGYDMKGHDLHAWWEEMHEERKISQEAFSGLNEGLEGTDAPLPVSSDDLFDDDGNFNPSALTGSLRETDQMEQGLMEGSIAAWAEELDKDENKALKEDVAKHFFGDTLGHHEFKTNPGKHADKISGEMLAGLSVQALKEDTDHNLYDLVGSPDSRDELLETLDNVDRDAFHKVARGEDGIEYYDKEGYNREKDEKIKEEYFGDDSLGNPIKNQFHGALRSEEDAYAPNTEKILEQTKDLAKKNESLGQLVVERSDRKSSDSKGKITGDMVEKYIESGGDMEAALSVSPDIKDIDEIDGVELSDIEAEIGNIALDVANSDSEFKDGFSTTANVDVESVNADEFIKEYQKELEKAQSSKGYDKSLEQLENRPTVHAEAYTARLAASQESEMDEVLDVFGDVVPESLYEDIQQDLQAIAEARSGVIDTMDSVADIDGDFSNLPNEAQAHAESIYNTIEEYQKNMAKQAGVDIDKLNEKYDMGQNNERMKDATAKVLAGSIQDMLFDESTAQTVEKQIRSLDVPDGKKTKTNISDAVSTAVTDTTSDFIADVMMDAENDINVYEAVDGIENETERQKVLNDLNSVDFNEIQQNINDELGEQDGK